MLIGEVFHKLGATKTEKIKHCMSNENKYIFSYKLLLSLVITGGHIKMLQKVSRVCSLK